MIYMFERAVCIRIRSRNFVSRYTVDIENVIDNINVPIVHIIVSLSLSTIRHFRIPMKNINFNVPSLSIIFITRARVYQL